MVNQKTAFAILLIVLALSVTSLAASASTVFPPVSAHAFPNAVGHAQLTLSSVLVISTSLHGNSSLEQPTRLEIYNYVKANPGIHFRGLCNGLSLSVGVVQYHIGVLEHAGLLTAYKDGQNKRYFESKIAPSDIPYSLF
jgi:predicted transcriptional regulator